MTYNDSNFGLFTFPVFDLDTKWTRPVHDTWYQSDGNCDCS